MYKLPLGGFFARLFFLRSTLVFIGGVLVAHFTDFAYGAIYWVFLLLISIYALLFLLQTKNKKHLFGTYFGIISLSAIFVGGYIRKLQQETNHIRHIWTHVSKNITAYEAVVTDEVHHKKRHKEAIVSVRKVYAEGVSKKAKGNILLHIPRHLPVSFGYGAVLLIQGAPELLKKPSNPYVVDYNTSYRLKGIFHKHKIKSLQVKGYDYPQKLKLLTLQIRHYCVKTLRTYCKDKTTLSIILAMVAGVRSELEKETRDIYVRTGLMHILAVSGLHVGLLYFLLLWFFFLIGCLFGYPRQQRFLAIFCLWVYAGVTGFSPSILRAVGMFTLIVCARWLQRDYHIINVLSAVAFFLLLHRPNRLFDLGFQLSFTAVLSIVLFYPIIASWYKTKHTLRRYWWQMTAVSLAAQVGTFPITLYYFKVFPTYFLLGNWVMLPLATLLLSLGVFILVISWWSWGANIVGWLLKHLILLTNSYLKYISALPYAQLGPFIISPGEVIAYYAILFVLYFAAIKQKKLRYLCIAIALICGLSGFKAYQRKMSQKQQYLIIYSVAPRRVIGFIKGQHAVLVNDKLLLQHSTPYSTEVKPSLVHLRIQKIKQHQFHDRRKTPSFFNYVQGVQFCYWGKKCIVVVDSPYTAPPPDKLPQQIAVLLVQENALQDIRPWLAYCSIDLLIISSAHKNGKKLILQATEQGIPCHVLDEQGGLIIPC